MSKLQIIPVATVASIAALVAGFFLFPLLAAAKQQSESVPIGGPFELVDQDGIKVTDKTFAGKPSLILFGFTSCPETCPLILTELSSWLNAIGPDADKLNVLFISIDPERDTSAHLKKYLSSFHPRIRGLTGTSEQIAAVAKEYRVYYKRIQLEKGVYALPHATAIYLMDRAGKLVGQISLQTEDKIAIERLRQLAAL